MILSDFDFNLNEELIAKQPLEKRDDSRMLIVKDKLYDSNIKNIIDFIEKDDVIVFNNTKVLPARFKAENYEITLHKMESKNIWWAFCKKFNKLNIGQKLNITNKDIIKILDKNDNSGIKIEFSSDCIPLLENIGKLPLPPYMKRDEELSDKTRYQTVYAKHLGSMAAPTAGLHFTENLINKIKEKKANIVNITLHVGSGTFAPVRCENINNHKMHSEYGIITKENADVINKGKRIIAIGTTSLRLLETAYSNGKILPFYGWTDIFIKPGYKFKTADILLTNFHLPKSTLLMLVSAFAGYDEIKKAYNHAIDEKYRFFSYGDCCLLFRK